MRYTQTGAKPADTGEYRLTVDVFLTAVERELWSAGHLVLALAASRQPAMTVWRAASGRLHLRATCSGGPGLSGIRAGRNRQVKVTQAEYAAAPKCIERAGWRADSARPAGDLAHARRYGP